MKTIFFVASIALSTVLQGSEATGLRKRKLSSGMGTIPTGVNFFNPDLMSTPMDKESKLKHAQIAAEKGVSLVKLWSWNDRDMLDALKSAYNSSNLDLQVMINIPNSEVIEFASSTEKAKDLLPVITDYPFVKCVAVGNEPDFPGGNKPVGGDLDIFNKLPDAVKNVHDTLKGTNVMVTVPWSQGVTDANNNDWSDVIIRPRNQDVVTNCMPYLDFVAFNPYPFFNWNDANIPKDWLLGKAPNGDSPSSLDSMVKNMRHALKALNANGSGEKQIAITETGWPTAGNSGCSIDNAKSYYENAQRMLPDMKKKYNMKADYVFWFELFDEGRKPGKPEEPHFGLLNEDGSPKSGLTEYVLSN